jgi:hypothetical protein
VPTVRALRSLPVPLLLAGAGFTLAVAQDGAPKPPPAPGPAPAPGAPQDPGAAPAPPAAPEFRPPAILAQRRKGLKEPTANAAVAAGLDWLRRHVADDGRFDCDGFEARCKGAKCGEPGMATFDPGVTGLAVLAFLGAGSTQTEGADAALVGKGLQYCLDIQDSEGCFGPRTTQQFLYNHATCAMAVAEALWLTGDEKLLGPATKARDFLVAAHNPYLAWRYGVRDGDNDTSVTTYAMVALRTCEFARLDVPADAWTGGRAWLEKMTDPSSGQAGYQQRGGNDARAWVREVEPDPPAPRPRKPDPPPSSDGSGVRPRDPPELEPLAFVSPLRTDAGNGSFSLVPDSILSRFPDSGGSALTAAAGAALSLVGGAESAELVDKWANLLALGPPNAKKRDFLDLHQMLYGSLFHAQRPFDARPKDEDAKKAWRPWRDAVVADLVAAQHAAADGCAAGSWDASKDPFGVAGGRVYTTAMAVLALEAPNRFPNVWNPRTKKLKLDEKKK